MWELLFLVGLLRFSGQSYSVICLVRRVFSSENIPSKYISIRQIILSQGRDGIDPGSDLYWGKGELCFRFYCKANRANIIIDIFVNTCRINGCFKWSPFDHLLGYKLFQSKGFVLLALVSLVPRTIGTQWMHVEWINENNLFIHLAKYWWGKCSPRWGRWCSCSAVGLGPSSGQCCLLYYDFPLNYEACVMGMNTKKAKTLKKVNHFV